MPIRYSRSHAHVVRALSADLDPLASARVQAELDDLAAVLRPLWDLPPRDQLVGCAAAMAERFTAVEEHDLDDLALPHVLAHRRGHPLLLAIVAADAGRRAGLPVGLVREGGAHHLAHVVLPEPLVADPRAGFAIVDLSGREESTRWPPPSEVTAALLELIAATASASGRFAYAARAETARRGLPLRSGGAM